jgi:hypothetical protein
MKWRKWVIMAIVCLILPVLVYSIYFRSHGISEDPAYWGSFGDFIGGTY